MVHGEKNRIFERYETAAGEKSLKILVVMILRLEVATHLSHFLMTIRLPSLFSHDEISAGDVGN